MPSNGGYVPGAWNVKCSMCGHVYKSIEMERNWQGQYRCSRCNEPRQPQDFVRGVVDDMSVPYAQPQNTSFVLFCDVNGSSAIPGYATPGCMIPGQTALQQN